jgi:hypothetical protein
MPVAIYEQPTVRMSTTHLPRPDTSSNTGRASVASHLRNALGLILIGGGSVGLMYYLIFETFAR